MLVNDYPEGEVNLPKAEYVCRGCSSTGLALLLRMLGTACVDEESSTVRRNMLSVHNRQHGVQAHFPARYMGVHGLLPFITYL